MIRRLPEKFGVVGESTLDPRFSTMVSALVWVPKTLVSSRQTLTFPAFILQWGGTPAEAFEAAANGGAPIPSHHSPLFKIEPEGSVTLGVEASVSALLDVMAAR